MSSGNPSAGNPFDPCRQWLGISALELDDPRKLLGLESLDDPIRILQAAETRIIRLQGVDAGPYEVARRALVARIEEARDRLLAAATARGTLAQPAAPGGLVMPPSPIAAPDDSTEFPAVTHAPGLPPPYQAAPYPYAYRHGQNSAPPMHAGLPAHVGHHQGPAGYPQAAGGYPQGMPGSDSYPPHSGPGLIPGSAAPIQPLEGLRGTGPIYRKSSSSEPLLLLVGALFAAVVVLGLFAMNVPPPKPVPLKPPTRNPEAGSPSILSKQLKPGGHQLAGRDRPFPMEEDDSLSSARSPDRPKSDTKAPPDEPAPPREDGGEGIPAVPPSEGDASNTDEPEPNEPQRKPANPPPPPEPPATPMKEPEPPPADEPDPLAKIDDAVKKCREALARREYDTAERSMMAVEGLAPKKREADRIAGWRQLATYAKGFFDYRDRAIAAMKPGDEYDVKTRKIAVVDVTNGVLTVRVSGEEKKWPLDDIPGAVLQAVVESWFDANPANQLYLGAYHFTKPEPDLEQAEACWSKAMIGGADASLLIPLLTDPVVVDAEDG